MTINDHQVFQPLFSNYVPRSTVVVGGRQYGKSFQLTARILMQSALFPGHSTLVALPLQLQAERSSHLIFKPLVLRGPIRTVLWKNARKPLAVNMHMYDNGSATHFGYATDDPDRMRGLTGIKWLYVDEAQDMVEDSIPILSACTDGVLSPVFYTSGTSKTKDTYLYNEWSRSSQGIWHVRCSACGFDNIFSLEPEGHLLATIGPPRDDISESRPGTICKGCKTPINPRTGRWVHRYPERMAQKSGFHMPQTIIPIHFANPEKWGLLVGKMNGESGFTRTKFYNEVLGEPDDLALKLLGRDMLKRAAKGVGPNTIESAVLARQRYRVVFLGVDWGGGGEDGVSRTKVAAAGIHNDGRVHVFYGRAFPPSTDSVGEAKEVMRLAEVLNASGIAHDFGGAGTVSESVLTHLGWPKDRLAPMRYQSYPGAPMIERKQPAGHRDRGYYMLDKGRSLQFLCNAVRCEQVRFFDYDYVDQLSPGLLDDFVCLVTHNMETPSGSVFRVRKSSPSACDDFAHASNFACCAIWESTGSWPSLAQLRHDVAVI